MRRICTQTIGVLSLLFFAQTIFAQSNGDYRSNAVSFNWSTAASWQIYSGGAWIAATLPPNYLNGIITIQSGHTVTLTSSVTMDQVVINNGGTLIIGTGGTATINGALIVGTADLIVNGTLQETGTGSLSNNVLSSNLFGSTGTYIHNVSNGTIPTATWQDGSTCTVTLGTGGVPSGLNQSFYHFTWNCPGQTIASASFAGQLTTVRGDLNLTSFGGNNLALYKSNGSYTLNVGGNFNYNSSSGSNDELEFNSGNGTVVINVGGNFNISKTDAGSKLYFNSGNGTTNVSVGGNFTYSGSSYVTFNTGNSTGASATNVTVTGNATLSGSGTLDFSTTPKAAFLIVGGNFSKTGGTFTSSGGTTGTVQFNGTGATQTISNNSSNTLVSYEVLSPANAVLVSSASFPVATGSSFTVFSGGTLDCGTGYLSGLGTFTLNSGGSLKMGDANGISSSGATGNIQTTTRTYNAGGNYYYNGAVAQITGNGLPTTISGSLTIANTGADVTLSQATTDNGNFTLAGNYNLITTPTNLLTLGTGSVSSRTGAGYVAGPLKRLFAIASSAKVFDVGNSAAGGYGGVTLTPPATASTYTITLNSGDHPDVTACIAGIIFNRSVNAYWTISSASPANTSATAAFDYSSAPLNKDAAMSAPLVRQNITAVGVAANWSSASPSAPSGAGITIPASTITGTYVIGDNSNVVINTQPVSSSICNGTSGSLTVVDNNPGGAYTYQWMISNASAGTYSNLTNSSPYSGVSTSTLVVNPVSSTSYYKVVVSNACGVMATSNSASITSLAPTSSHSITVSPSSICSGSSASISFSTTQTNTTYTLRNDLNNSVVSSSTTPAVIVSPVSFTVSPVISTTYNVLVTDAGGCTAVEGTKPAVSVTATVTPSVSIVYSMPGGLCGGTVNFTATPLNEGNAPVYAWYKNNTLVAGVTSGTYSASGFVNGDAVYCVLTSNATCASPATVTSNTENIVIVTTATWTGAAGTTSWINPLNWDIPGGTVYPLTCMDVIIPTTPSGGMVFPVISSNVGIINSLTIQPSASVTIQSGGSVVLNNQLTVNGTLDNSGTLSMNSGKAFTISSTGTYIHNTSNSADATMFTNGVESFASTSNLIVKGWYDYTLPLANDMTGNYGNVTIHTGNGGSSIAGGTYWRQNGKFRSNLILGTLTIQNANVVLDNGNSSSNGAGTTTIPNILLDHSNAVLTFRDGVPGAGSNSFSGSVSLNVTGTFTISSNGGTFNGLSAYSTVTSDVIAETCNFSAGRLVLNGGLFNGTDANVKAGAASITGTVNTAVTNNITLNNGAVFNGVSVGSNFSNFNSSISSSTINLQATATGTFTGNASAGAGQTSVTVSSQTNIAGGSFAIARSTGTAAMTTPVYIQSGGNLFLYSGSPASSNVGVSVTSSFTHSGGGITYDNAASTGTRTISITGANYTLSGTGTITGGGVTGFLVFNRPGATISFVRSGSHNIQGVKQTVVSNCTLDISSGNLQIGSSTPSSLDQLTVNGILNMNTNQIYSNSTLSNSGLTVSAGGVLKTQNTNGFYNASGTACINNSGNMDFYLDQNSTVEYNGTASVNQILTGIGNGITSSGLDQYKYGNLTINFTGASGSVFPLASAGNAIVRGVMDLKAGALNLGAVNGNPVSAGHSVLIGNSGNITRSGSGYIRSETYDNSGKVKWYIGSTPGSYVIPFGKSSAAGDYIPFTFRLTSGTADTISVSTYSTGANNQPLPVTPTTVTHLKHNVTFLDNSANTVDRFWQIDKTGANATADVTFSYALSEEPSGASAPYSPGNGLIAQRWNGNNWSVGSGSWTAATASAAGQVVRTGITTFSPWTLANQMSPLPVELISFTAKPANNKEVEVKWITATEVNNDYFTVEKTRDLKHFELVSTIPGAENSAVIREYAIMDENPYSDVSYYRLTQVDLDGKTSFSQIVNVDLGTFVKDMSVSPNPVSDREAKVSFSSSTSFESALTIKDMKGVVISQQLVKVNEGENTVSLNVSELPSGAYFVEIPAVQDVFRTRFIK